MEGGHSSLDNSCDGSGGPILVAGIESIESVVVGQMNEAIVRIGRSVSEITRSAWLGKRARREAANISSSVQLKDMECTFRTSIGRERDTHEH